jgi:hypothetical protein
VKAENDVQYYQYKNVQVSNRKYPQEPPGIKFLQGNGASHGLLLQKQRGDQKAAYYKKNIDTNLTI